MVTTNSERQLIFLLTYGYEVIVVNVSFTLISIYSYLLLLGVYNSYM
jgi:hypothetical protein